MRNHIRASLSHNGIVTLPKQPYKCPKCNTVEFITLLKEECSFCGAPIEKYKKGTIKKIEHSPSTRAKQRKWNQHGSTGDLK